MTQNSPQNIYGFLAVTLNIYLNQSIMSQTIKIIKVPIFLLFENRNKQMKSFVAFQFSSVGRKDIDLKIVLYLLLKIPGHKVSTIIRHSKGMNGMSSCVY